VRELGISSQRRSWRVNKTETTTYLIDKYARDLREYSAEAISKNVLLDIRGLLVELAYILNNSREVSIS
jgi:hypothetical protein